MLLREVQPLSDITVMCRARVLERCCSMCGLYNQSAFTMHALSLSDGLFPCISLMRVMHRGLAMHPSNHLEMWNHVNPYKGRFNTLENVSWELDCVLPQSMSGVQWTVAWSLWSVNRESSIFRAWSRLEKHAALSRHFHNGGCLCDLGK